MCLLNFGLDSMGTDWIEVPHVVGLPEGAKIVSVHADHSRRTIGVIVEHESFPDTPPGEMLDVIKGPLEGICVNVERVASSVIADNEELRRNNSALRKQVDRLVSGLAYDGG